MYGPTNVKFVNAIQAKETYQYTPDDGRKDCPKHVECCSKINKFEILCIWLVLL